MATKGEMVDKVINIYKLHNKDEHTSRRLILKLLEDTATFLISQRYAERSILSESNLYTYIPCFEFEKVEAKKCDTVEFRLCNTLMKSKKPLPKLIFSKLGSSIRDIVSLDGNFKFTFIDEVQYRRNKKRPYKLKDEVYIYLGADNHLYIPDNEVYSVDLTVLTTKPEDAEKCSSCSDGEGTDCKSVYSYDFICPDKMIGIVLDDTLNKMGINKQVRNDENPNNVAGA
jgi:hypothetical protein